MPNGKTDVNNKGPFSTDMIGMNYEYPEASWERRKEIIQAHKSYTLGLMWFYVSDPRVPASMRDEIKKWGWAKDEYPKTGNWTHQLYIREARRMIGEYVATQADCEGKGNVQDGIGYAAYTMDSHNCERLVIEKDGKLMVKNEGDVQVRGGVPYYPISYRSITPKREECTNLLVPVCLSSSHIAYGSIRMEPVFLELGQVSGMAAAIAGKKPVHAKPVRPQGAGVERVTGKVRVGNDDFVAVPHLGQRLEEIRRNNRRNAFQHALTYLSSRARECRRTDRGNCARG